MPAEGDRRPRVLENNVEQHIGIPDTEAEAAEAREMSSIQDIAIDTQTPIREKFVHMLLLCLGLAFCCISFVFIIYSLIKFITVLSDEFEGKCPVNGTFPLP